MLLHKISLENVPNQYNQTIKPLPENPSNLYTAWQRGTSVPPQNKTSFVISVPLLTEKDWFLLGRVIRVSKEFVLFELFFGHDFPVSCWRFSNCLMNLDSFIPFCRPCFSKKIFGGCRTLSGYFLIFSCCYSIKQTDHHSFELTPVFVDQLSLQASPQSLASSNRKLCMPKELKYQQKHNKMPVSKTNPSTFKNWIKQFHPPKTRLVPQKMSKLPKNHFPTSPQKWVWSRRTLLTGTSNPP